MGPTSYQTAPSRDNIILLVLEQELKEMVGFEPTRRFPDLTVFKTVPFSQTWVHLHELLNSTKVYGPCRTRTDDRTVMSRLL